MATAVVTGGAQGIGRATVAHFLRKGWRVAAVDLDGEALKDLTAEAPAGDLLPIEADVADEESVRAAFARMDDWRGEEGLDLLFNNAGISGPDSGPVEALSLAEWRRRLDSHLTGAFLMTRAAVPALRQARGAIVNMASTRAFQSEPNSEAYAAAKGGIVALTHALSVSLGPDVRVNAVAPGWIDTAPLAKRSARAHPAHDPQDHAQHPVGRIGRPEDVATTVDFLASEAAAFMTGETLVLDGGMRKRMRYAD